MISAATIGLHSHVLISVYMHIGGVTGENVGPSRLLNWLVDKENMSSYRSLDLHKLKLTKLDVCLSVHRCICVEKENQRDATEWFIALIIRSTCFGHFYAHHHVHYYRLWCAVLGCWLSGVRCWTAGYTSRMRDVARLQSCSIPVPGRIACCSAHTRANQ